MEALELVQLWPVLKEGGFLWLTVVGILCGLGEVLKANVPARFELYHSTLTAHPIIAGMVFGGLCPWLLPAWFPAGHVAGVLFFGSAGVASVVAYDLVHGWRKKRGKGCLDAGETR